MSQWLGMDPGTEHVGLSWWKDGGCWQAIEIGVDEAADYLWENARIFDEIYVEEYNPSGGFGSGASAHTLELVGVARHAARRSGVGFTIVTRIDRNASKDRIKGAGFRIRNRHALDAVAVVVAARRIPVVELEEALSRVG